MNFICTKPNDDLFVEGKIYNFSECTTKSPNGLERGYAGHIGKESVWLSEDYVNKYFKDAS